MSKKAAASFQDRQKEFMKIFRELCYSRQPWEVWSDVITAMACSIANAVDRTPERHEKREKEYACRCMEYEAAVRNGGKYMWDCGHEKTSGKRALLYVF